MGRESQCRYLVLFSTVLNVSPQISSPKFSSADQSMNEPLHVVTRLASVMSVASTLAFGYIHIVHICGHANLHRAIVEDVMIVRSRCWWCEEDQTVGVS